MAQLAPPSADYAQERASFWRVSRGCIQNWMRATPPAPLDDVEGMAKWAAQSPARKPAAFRQRLYDLRQKSGGKNEADIGKDWEDFERARAKRELGQKSDQAELIRFRDFAVYKLAKAHGVGDEVAARIYSDLHIKYEKAIRDNKLADMKLGIEEGELLPRKVAEAWLFAWGFWSLREVDLRLDEICAELAGATKDLSAEQCRKIIEPRLLCSKLLVPFAKATKYAAGTGLPEWAVAKARDVIDDLLHRGASQFDEEFHAGERKAK